MDGRWRLDTGAVSSFSNAARVGASAGGGGDAAAGTFDTTLATAEIYDPATDRWSAANRLRTARAGHTATALADGRVLVVGGANFAGGRILYDINEAEVFNEQGLLWTSGGLMTPRVEHTATRPANG